MLVRRGHHVSRKRVARLMRAAGIAGVTRRRWKHGTTVRDRAARPAPDLVDRRFVASGPNQLWVADITQIPTHAGPLFLATVMDVWSRKVVGWATSTRMPSELVIAALEMAIARRRPKKVVHHSDQGSQYTSVAFTERCNALGVSRSMGSVGDCFDNAMAESFFATLETELLGLVDMFPTIEVAEAELFQFLEGFYNTRRLHSALGHLSPVEFERQGMSAQAVDDHPQASSLPPRPPRSTSIASAQP
jgi:putative transposase